MVFLYLRKDVAILVMCLVFDRCYEVVVFSIR